VLIDKRKRQFCNREYENGKACQDIGPLLRYAQSLEANECLQKFETEYNRIYSRFYRADGKTDEGHKALFMAKNNPSQVDPNGMRIHASHIHGELRRVLGLDRTTFPKDFPLPAADGTLPLLG
jgi:hypothetical protein